MITTDKENKKILDEMFIIRQWSQNTYRSYTTAVNIYSEVNNASLDKLVDEADLEEEQQIKRNKRKIKQRFINFQKELLNRGYNKTTIKLYINRVKSIYHYFDLEIPNIPPIKITNNSTYTDLLTRDEFVTILTNANSTMRAIITFGASTGLRISDIANLTVNDFLEATKEYQEYKSGDSLYNHLIKLESEPIIVPTWKITSIKTKVEHTTFNSDESSRYILQYLKERILSSNLELTDKLFHLTAHTITVSLKRLNDRLNLGKTMNNYSKLHSHGLRKYMSTTLINDGLDFLTVEFMLGHTLNKVQQSYYYANPEKLKQKYIKFMDSLTFIRKINYIEVDSKEKQELEQLRYQNEKNNVRLKQLEEMVNFLSSNVDL